jgi:hypothetical protein
MCPHHGFSIAECGIQIQDAFMVVARTFSVAECREPGFLHQAGVSRLHAAGDAARIQSLNVGRIGFQTTFGQLQCSGFQFLYPLLDLRVENELAFLIKETIVGIKARIQRANPIQFTEHDCGKHVVDGSGIVRMKR